MLLQHGWIRSAGVPAGKRLNHPPKQAAGASPSQQTKGSGSNGCRGQDEHCAFPAVEISE
jgi:hypothetical protein